VAALFLRAFATFMALVAVHLLLCRFRGSTRFAARAYAFFVFGSIAAFPLLPQKDALRALVTYALLILLWNTYVIVLINIQNSITLHFLGVIRRTAGGISITDLLGSLSRKYHLGARMVALESNGFIRHDPGEGYRLTERGKLIVRMVSLIQRTFGLGGQRGESNARKKLHPL